MENQSSVSSSGLRRHLSPLGAWALIFGCSVGWGSFVMPGTTFLPLAGPLGAAIGLAVGTVVMGVVGLNFYYMMNRYPDSGGAYSYAKHVLGHDHGFLNAWCLILVYLAIVWANATVIPIVFRKLLGDALQWGACYQLAGFKVYLGEALISDAFIIGLVFICIRGGRLAIGVQIVMALLLLLGVFIGFGAALTEHGSDIMRIQPKFASGRHWLGAIINIAVLAPWAFAGFESFSHSVEEFKFSPKRILPILLISLPIIGLTYIALVLVSVSTIPNEYGDWHSYILNLDNVSSIQSIPVLNALNEMMGRKGLALFGCAVIAGVTTGIFGNCFVASRILYSMAKDSIIPEWFGRLNKARVPRNALLFIMLLSLPIPFFGRTAIGWIVDVNTIGAAIAYFYTSAVAFWTARKAQNTLVQFTGLAGAVLSTVFFLYYMLPNLWTISGLGTESYLIFIIWSILGIVFFRYILSKDKVSRRFGKSIITWVVLLSLIFLTSMLWLRQATHETTSAVLNNLNDYNVKELAEHGVPLTEKDKGEAEQFLQAQMTIVSDSVKNNSLIQIGLITASLLVMFNIYRLVMRREKDLEIEKAQAEQLNAAQSAFFSQMSHDMRTPLNAVLGYVGLARKMDGITPRMEDYLGKIESSGQRLLQLVNDILEMSRIKSGKVKLEMARADLVKGMESLRTMFSMQMEAKNIAFAVTGDDVADRFVVCDMNHLERVLQNLVSNAYKYTPEGGEVQVSLKETSRTETIGEYEIRVKDTGIGMSPDFLCKVFDAYERDEGARNIQGTGLGMAIVKSLVDMMGGTIGVTSELGKGTEFVLRISFMIAEKISEDIDKKDNTVEDVHDFSNVRLLLVDDNEINREIARMILEEAGFVLDEAENGKEAVDRIASSEAGHYQAVLMDVQMPVMNGYEATRAIRALPNAEKASIPVIAMSANTFYEDIQKGREAGMNAHVAKPVNVTKLLATLSDVLGKSIPAKSAT